MSEVHETLLEWISERGEGTWGVFRESQDWFLNKGRSDQSRTPPARTATTMSILGHLEIDWSSRKWSAAPAVLTIVPSGGANALLTGGRTRQLLADIAEATNEEVTQDLLMKRLTQPEAPDAIHIASENEQRVEELARTLGIRYEYSVADRLSRILPSVDDYLESARSTPAPGKFETERYLFRNGAIWDEVSSDASPGLYRYNTWGGYTYRFFSDGHHYDVDLATGVYAELSRTGSSVLEYVVNEVNGTLRVPWGAPLPILYARAAALCTGIEPRSILSYREFRNVPAEIAQRIAGGLGQRLAVKGRPN